MAPPFPLPVLLPPPAPRHAGPHGGGGFAAIAAEAVQRGASLTHRSSSLFPMATLSDRGISSYYDIK